MEAYERFKSVDEGKNADCIPALARVPRELFGICVVGVSGGVQAITVKDLATMAATLANGGGNPLTRERVVDAIHYQHVLAVMVTAGLYENSRDWLYETGLPGKSGVSGGLVTVSPGKGGLGTLAPPLDDSGNSVKGQLIARFLSQQLGLNLFASEPAMLQS